MKAISLWQPYGSAVALGVKRFETRHWKTSYRGPLAIHSSKKSSKELQTFFENQVLGCELRHAFTDAGFYSWCLLPKGAIVALCDLVDCVPTEYMHDALSKTEAMLGDYSPNRYAWILQNVRPLKQPYFMAGHQKLFNVPDDILKEVA